MLGFNRFSRKDLTQAPLPNRWDWVALSLLLIVLAMLGWGGQAMSTPYELGQPIPIDLAPAALPSYALRSTLRMVLAMLVSLVFTAIIGTLAAHSRRAERFLIPLIDVLQSVPVLGFLSVSIWGFVKLFPNSLLGPECAAIFAIFTSQVWNMTLSFYQSLKTLPQELVEACHMLQLSPWRRFWHLEVPYAIPGLLWNSMLSMATGWFFVVASEAIDIAHQKILLPGIGSYIAVAVQQANTTAIGYAIATMMSVIFLFDQLVFSPLSLWACKFQRDGTDVLRPEQSWVMMVFSRTQLIRSMGHWLAWLGRCIIALPIGHKPNQPLTRTPSQSRSRQLLSYAAALSLAIATAATIYHLCPSWTLAKVTEQIIAGAVTSLRIFVLIALCVVIWTPVGVWVGQRPKLALRLQPVIQFLAAFPANLLFPTVIYYIVTYKLNINIWTSPLIVLGTQWYILFNVIAGTLIIPKNLRHAMKTLHLSRLQWWRRVIIPAIFPHLVTGMISATGGAWNASILAEAVTWGHHTIHATGLGSNIALATQQGNFGDLTLGIVVMCGYVLILNRLIWQPLYNLAAERYAMPLT